MADWSTIEGSSRWEDVGTDSATSTGTDVAAGNPANSKGSWVELIASTTFDAGGMILSCSNQGTSITSVLFDIAVGAEESEQVIIPNFLLDVNRQNNPAIAFFPISIPAGTRFSARCQANIADLVSNTMIHLVSPGFLNSSPLQIVREMGANTGTSSGTVIDPGPDLNTKAGGWIEITASTPIDFKNLIILIGNNINAVQQYATWLIDLGIGAGGSEQVILPDFGLYCSALSDWIVPTEIFLPVFVPSGTRIAVRAQSSINDAVDRKFTVVVYGIG